MDDLLFEGKYRIPSARLRGRDYAAPGTYFITICTKGRVRWFGDVRNGFVCLSDVGTIADACWHDIPLHFPHVQLMTHVIMPDHMHGLIRIMESPGVETPHEASLRHAKPINPHHRPQWHAGCLGAIINQYKSACTRYIRAAGHADFAWQPRYHDRVVRDDNERRRIAWYIRNNPVAWGRGDDRP